MCNYGRGHKISDADMVCAVEEGISELGPGISELSVSPSGSLLDANEVPLQVRDKIFEIVNAQPINGFTFETRAETVTEGSIGHLVTSLGSKSLGVEMGLESSNPWVQRYCVNKGNTPAAFVAAGSILAKYNLQCLANISLGTAFLTPKEALLDAFQSVSWALANGAHTAMLFPLHVKPYTLLEWLYRRGYYRPASLWSLVEVLHILGPELQGRTDISWYRNCYIDESKIVTSPTTCPNCIEAVLQLLDEYRAKRSPRAIEELRSIQCSCREQWREEIDTGDDRPLRERVFEIYRELAVDFSFSEWWSANGMTLLQEMSCSQ